MTSRTVTTQTEAPEVGRSTPVAAALLNAGLPREHVTAATAVLAAVLADAVGQRDTARRWAVALEQENAELIRRHTVALALLDEAGCGCSDPDPSAAVLACIKHQAEDVLRTGSLP